MFIHVKCDNYDDPKLSMRDFTYMELPSNENSSYNIVYTSEYNFDTCSVISIHTAFPKYSINYLDCVILTNIYNHTNGTHPIMVSSGNYGDSIDVKMSSRDKILININVIKGCGFGDLQIVLRSYHIKQEKYNYCDIKYPIVDPYDSSSISSIPTLLMGDCSIGISNEHIPAYVKVIANESFCVRTAVPFYPDDYGIAKLYASKNYLPSHDVFDIESSTDKKKYNSRVTKEYINLDGGEYYVAIYIRENEFYEFVQLRVTHPCDVSSSESFYNAKIIMLITILVTMF